MDKNINTIRPGFVINDRPWLNLRKKISKIDKETVGRLAYNLLTVSPLNVYYDVSGDESKISSATVRNS